MRLHTFVSSVMLALAIVAVPAHAGLVVHDFSVAPGAGPLAGTPFGGRFTYDSSIVPVGGSGIVTTGPGGSALRSFRLELGDTRFTAGNVQATLIFQNGELSRFRIGETTPGASTDGTDYFFMDSLFGSGVFRLAGDPQLYSGLLSTTVATPEIDRYLLNVALVDGPLAGQTVTGSFAVDHALAQPNSLQEDAVDTRGNLNSLLDFEFALNGIEYTTANTGVARLGFDASGRVNEFLIGADRSLELGSFTDDFMMLHGANGFKLFSYTVRDSARFGSGELSFALATPPAGAALPEPPGLAVLALGTAALFSRRRAPARSRG